MCKPGREDDARRAHNCPIVQGNAEAVPNVLDPHHHAGIDLGDSLVPEPFAVGYELFTR